VLIDPKELKESEYDKFSNFLESLHFLSINIWEDELSDFWDYRTYVGFEEFENDDGDKVTVYYTKVSTNEGTVYYIEKIRVEERSKEGKTSDKMNGTGLGGGQ
jgi:hypothetical protein